MFVTLYSNGKFSMQTHMFFDINNKSQKERVSTESMNYLIKHRLSLSLNANKVKSH